MAMKTASPWWFSATFAAGLLLLFLGERPFQHLDAVRLLLSGAGGLLLLGMTALRFFTFSSTRGDRRAVERGLLLCHVGVLLALALFGASTAWGRDLLGLGGLEGEALDRYTVPMTVLWLIVMALSLVPMLMIEVSLGTARRSSFSFAAMRHSEADEEAVEAFRVREMAASGLTTALALSFLMVTCNIAEQRNVRRDVSYFKVSSPGEATINIARNTTTPVRVLLFFAEVDEIKNQVRGYLQELIRAGGKLTIEEHDRMRSAELAREYRVRNEGTVVFIHGGKFESIQLTVDARKRQTRAARMELRELDGKVNKALLEIVRAERIAYMTVGHGELNDKASTWGTGSGAQTTRLEAMLRSLNYQIRDLGLMEGLGSDVPVDADLVLVLAPREPLSDEAMASLDRYLARGGKLMVVLDPLSNADLGVMEKRLAVRFSKAAITDDKNHLAASRTAADRRIIITNRFSSHASMTSLGRSGARQAIPLINAGSVERLDLIKGMPVPDRTYVLRSMNDSFADLNNNFRFDEDTEKRRQYNLAAAIEIERPDGKGTGKRKGKGAQGDGAGAQDDGETGAQDDGETGAQDDGDPGAQPGKEDAAGDQDAAAGAAQAEDDDSNDMRVMVFTDADIFIDRNQLEFPLLGALFSDAVKWLGGEEHIAGQIESEKDVLIQHTRSEDVLLFYGTIVGAPLLVLAFGLGLAWWRRNRIQRRAS